MSNSIFNFDSAAVRVGGSAECPVFVAKDVCSALGIGHYGNVIADLEDYEKGYGLIVHTLGGKQSLATVTEAGLYSIIMRSRKPSAKLFRRWITTEVIPSIRKTGSYQIEKKPAPPKPPRMFPEYAIDFEMPDANGGSKPDLVGDHVSKLLRAVLQDRDTWSGKIRDLAKAACSAKLFFWLLRSEDDLAGRVRLGKALSLRNGGIYLGECRTALRLSTVGRHRHRKYVVERIGPMLRGPWTEFERDLVLQLPQ
jgi:hypothetical protein